MLPFRSSFFLPMLLMPAKKRQAAFAIYEFCRKADDAVDDAVSKEQAITDLSILREEVGKIFAGNPSTKLGIKLFRANQAFSFKQQYFFDLLSGMERDIASFDDLLEFSEEELEEYCYQAAGTVGLLMMAIFGGNGEEYEHFALELAKALQKTNILRDIDEDLARNRVYIPKTYGDINNKGEIIINFAPIISGHYENVFELSKKLNPKTIKPAMIMGKTYHDKFIKIKNSSI